MGAEGKVTVKDSSDSTLMEVMNSDSKFSSNADINKLINTEGSNMLVLSGEGDYMVPTDGILKQLRKEWDVKDKAKVFGVNEKWNENDDYFWKKSENFEFRRIKGGGHLIPMSNRILHGEIITEFLD